MCAFVRHVAADTAVTGSAAACAFCAVDVVTLVYLNYVQKSPCSYRALLYLLLSRLPDWRGPRNLGGVRRHCACTVLLQQVQGPVEEVANIICQSRVDDLSETPF